MFIQNKARLAVRYERKEVSDYTAVKLNHTR